MDVAEGRQMQVQEITALDVRVYLLFGIDVPILQVIGFSFAISNGAEVGMGRELDAGPSPGRSAIGFCPPGAK